MVVLAIQRHGLDGAKMRHASFVIDLFDVEWLHDIEAALILSHYVVIERGLLLLGFLSSTALILLKQKAILMASVHVLNRFARLFTL